MIKKMYVNIKDAFSPSPSRMSNNFWNKLKRPFYALAPLAGYTDSAFRQVCKGFGAEVVYSELVSDRLGL